jgi:hypothetical protein
MHKLLASVLLMSVILLTACETDAGGPPKIIAEYSAGDGNVTFYWGSSGGAAKVEWAQGFLLTSDSTCSAVELYVIARSGTPVGDYAVRIETNNTDRPSGILVDAGATRTIAASGLADDSWDRWTFDSSFNLMVGETYWIVCSTTEPISDDNRVHIRGDSDPAYLDGDTVFYSDGTYVTSYDDQDIYFRVYD